MFKQKISTIRPMFPDCFPPENIRIFSASSTRPNVSSLFGKTATLFKCYHTKDFFLKIFFLDSLFPENIPKIYVTKSAYSGVTVGTM